MGFDNECILNIQSLAGEYFCPVCRLLVYPNEAIQSQCTHLYCKPCLTYVVSTTRACPYDGYLVTEADSKPLVESNKALAETIEKIAVHCLYHRSGCTWQGSLSECTTHCGGCAYGNSPVVCNRCGTQIVHRQVQEHAQNCPGVQPQAQQAEGGQDATAATGTTVAAEQNQAATQTGATASQAQTSQVSTSAAPPSGQDQSQAAIISTQSQATGVVAPTNDQWYQQQQYQQYYQQYPGYDPYQQQYQQYNPYQQQPAPVTQGQQPAQLNPQAQPQTVSQFPRPHVHPQPQPQAQPQPQSQLPMQQITPHQLQPHMHPPPQSHQHPQLYPQHQPHPQPHQAQNQPFMQQRPQVTHPQMQVPQPHQLSQSHPQPHPVPQHQPQSHPQTQLQHPNMQVQPQPQLQPHPNQHPSSHAAVGHQPYPQPHPYQQIAPGAPQNPPHMQPQQGAPLQASQMRPPQAQIPVQHQQPPATVLPQGQRQQPVHPQAHHPGQAMQQHHGMNPLQQPVPRHQVHGHLNHSQSFPGQNQPHQPGPFVQQQGMQTHLRPQGPPPTPQQLAHPNQPLQHNVPIVYGMQPNQSQNHAGRPVMPNQQFHQSTGVPGHAMPIQPNGMQPSLNQSHSLSTNNRPQHSAPQRSMSNNQLPAVQPTAKSEVPAESGTSLKPDKDEVKSLNKDQGQSVQQNFGIQESLETSKTSQKDSEEPVVKQIIKEESAADPSKGGILANNKHEENGGNQDVLQKNEPSEHSEIVEKQDSKLNKDVVGPQVPSAPGGMKDPQGVSQDSVSVNEMTVQDRNSSQQSPRNKIVSHSGYNDKSLSQNQIPSSIQTQGNNQQLPTHYRPPHMLDQAHQRPPLQMHASGPPLAYMRPSGLNSVGNLHPQGQATIPPESFQPPIGKQSHGSFYSEVPPGVIPPGSSASFGRGPLVPPRSYEPHATGPLGNQNPGHMPPHLAGARNLQGEPIGLPPHSALDSQGGMVVRGPPRGSDGQPHPAHPIDAANKRPGYFEGSQLNSMKINGAPSKEFSGGLQDPSFPYGLQADRFRSAPEERYRRLPEEGFNRLPGEHVQPFPVEPNKRVTDRREFEEDLKQFPGPGHVDGGHMPKFDSYRGMHSDKPPYGLSRDAGVHYDGGPSGGAPRLFPPYQPGNSSMHPMRPVGFPDENPGRRMDPVHPDFLPPASEFGRHLPPRSPGREYPRFGSGTRLRSDGDDGRETYGFGERSKSFKIPPDGNEFHEGGYPIVPSHLRRGEQDSPDIVPGHLPGIEPVGSRRLSSHTRMGDRSGFGSYVSHSHMGGPGDLPLNMHGESFGRHAHIGEPGFGSGFPYRGRQGDESFDQSRKRKHGSMGWCRICKIDCETVEGLELHSQTREHQKTAMDIVLSIKKDNAKKQKLSSDDNISHDDANKSTFSK